MKESEQKAHVYFLSPSCLDHFSIVIRSSLSICKLRILFTFSHLFSFPKTVHKDLKRKKNLWGAGGKHTKSQVEARSLRREWDARRPGNMAPAPLRMASILTGHLQNSSRALSTARGTARGAKWGPTSPFPQWEPGSQL